MTGEGLNLSVASYGLRRQSWGHRVSAWERGQGRRARERDEERGGGGGGGELRGCHT